MENSFSNDTKEFLPISIERSASEEKQKSSKIDSAGKLLQQLCISLRLLNITLTIKLPFAYSTVFKNLVALCIAPKIIVKNDSDILAALPNQIFLANFSEFQLVSEDL